MGHLKTVVLSALLLSGCFISSVHSGCLDELHFTGTHYAFGYCIGLQYKDQIQSLVNGNYSAWTNLLDPFYQNAANVATLSAYRSRAQTSFPQYAAELTGMSDASGVVYDKLLMLNSEAEIFNLVNAFPETLDGTESSVVQHASGTTYLRSLFITHFLDWEPLFDADGFLVDAKIIDPAYSAVEDQEFHSFMFPGFLAGTTFTYNKYGLLYTVNRLYQNQNPALNLIPSAFLLRDLISAKNYTEAYALTQSLTTAFALSVNINFYDTTQAPDFNAAEWSILSPGVSVSSSNLIQQTQDIFYHFNRYKLMTPTSQQTFYQPLSTEYREANVAMFLLNGVPQTFEEVKAFVSNEEFSEFPQYRAVEKYTDHVTTFNMIFDIAQNKIYVYPGQPDSTYEAIVLTPPTAKP